MQTYGMKIRKTLCQSASIIAVAATCAGLSVAADAGTVVLTSANSPYDIVNGFGNTVEVTSGNTAELTSSATPATSGNQVIQWSWPILTADATTVQSFTSNCLYGNGNCVSSGKILVDSGATLQVYNSWNWMELQSVITANGNVVFKSGTTTALLGSNYLYGDVILADGTAVKFGESYIFSNTYFGTGTDFIMGTGTALNFYEPHTMTNTVNTFSSADTKAAILFNNGTMIVNGANTASSSYYGSVTINAGAVFMVGDADHSSAVFGDVNGSATTITVTQSSGTLGTLSGYGKIYGSVTSNGIVRPGGTSGVAGTLTITGDYTQTSDGQLAVEVTPSGASKLVVGDTATLSGSLTLNVNKGNYTNGIYTILSAGSVSGSFSSYKISGDTSSAIIGVGSTRSGYSIVTQRAGSAQIMNHAASANRGLIGSISRTIYDQLGSTGASGGSVTAWGRAFGRVENVGNGGVGYDVKYGGLVGGGEYHFADANAVIGGAFSYAHGEMGLKNDASTLSSDAFTFALYGGGDLEFARVDGMVFANYYIADASRDLNSYGKAKSSPSGTSYGASFQVSRNLFDNLISPFLRGTYLVNQVTGETETGNSSFILDYKGQSQTSFSGDVGVRVHALTPTPDLKAKLDFTVAVSHEFSSPETTAAGSFASLSGSPFSVVWKGNSANTLLVGTDFTYTVKDGIDLYARLNGELSTKERGGDLFIGGRYRF